MIHDVKTALQDANLVKTADQIVAMTESEYRVWMRDVATVTADAELHYTNDRDMWKSSN